MIHILKDLFFMFLMTKYVFETFKTWKWQKQIMIAFFEIDPGVILTHSVILFYIPSNLMFQK